MPTIRLTTHVDAPVDEVFDLARHLGLHVASTPTTRERVVDGTESDLNRLGEHVTWQTRHLGLRVTRTSQVTEMQRPHRFVREQVEGPFAEFRHEYVFVPDGGGTRMVEHVTFRAPYGVLGTMACAAGVTAWLRRVLTGRNEFLRRTAESRRQDAA